MSLRWLHQKATSQQHHGEVQARGCWIPWEHTAVPGDPGLPRRPAELPPLELTRVSKSLVSGTTDSRLAESGLASDRLRVEVVGTADSRLAESGLASDRLRVEVVGTADSRLAESGLASGRQDGCRKKKREKRRGGRAPLIYWLAASGSTRGPRIENGRFEFHLPKTY